MFEIKKWRAALLGISLLILGLTVWLMTLHERSVCMGVGFITEEAAAEYTPYTHEDLGEHLLFNGEKLALDTANNTVYISQSLEEDTQFWQLPGELTVDLEDHRLFFLEDEAFGDMKTAVAQGHNFVLMVTEGDRVCMHYKTVFTTLPVMRLEGTYSHTNEDDREVLEGSLCLWTPQDPETGRYSVKTSQLQWHLRGGSTAMIDKNSWKLSAKTKAGENQNISLLGLGKDDDWILNSMSADDTKVKEKVTMELWNQLASQTEYNYKMSAGEYVELVINGEYYGLYLLQRRVDKKYLELDSGDILLKGKPVWEAPEVSDAYEIIYSPLSEAQTYALMEGVWSNTDTSMIGIDNFIDVSLLVQLGGMTDNTGYKNMFYVLKKQEDGYRLSFVPWDTDLSFGTTWVNGFIHDPGLNMNTSLDRTEYAALQAQNPALDARFAQRWQQLRQGVLSEESLISAFHRAEEGLDDSGALLRDQIRWGVLYGGVDSVDSACRYVQERIHFMDERYQMIDCLEEEEEFTA